MFKKPKQIDQSALDELRLELAIIQKYETDAKTEAGQHLLELIEDTIQDTVKKFALEEVEKFDTDTKIILFLSSCRSKLQTLIALKQFYAGAERKKKELSDELERLLSNP